MTSLSLSPSFSLRSVFNRRSTPYIVAVVLGASAIAYALYAGPNQLEKARLLARYTARAAFLIFIVTYAASALARLWPNPISLGLMCNRFHWGMGFGLAMLIHIVSFSPLLFMDNNGEQGQAIYMCIAALIRSRRRDWRRATRLALRFFFLLSLTRRLRSCGFGRTRPR